jgi:hypothetical protein
LTSDKRLLRSGGIPISFLVCCGESLRAAGGENASAVD